MVVRIVVYCAMEQDTFADCTRILVLRVAFPRVADEIAESDLPVRIEKYGQGSS